MITSISSNFIQDNMILYMGTGYHSPDSAHGKHFKNIYSRFEWIKGKDNWHRSDFFLPIKPLYCLIYVYNILKSIPLLTDA